MTLPDIQERQLPNQQNAEQATSSQALSYRLRGKRAPRHKCGTCGSRNCSCVHLVTSEPPDHRLARGAVIPAHELSITRRPEPPPTQRPDDPDQRTGTPSDGSTSHYKSGETYTSVHPGVVPPLETTLEAMQNTSPSGCLNYRFTKRTNMIETVYNSRYPPSYLR